MSEVNPAINAAVKGKGMPPPKGLGKGAPPKGPPTLPRGGLQRPPSSEALGPKLRPLFWTAVTQVPAESVWTDLVKPAPFDKALLERQFALADSRTPMSSKAASAPGSRSASEEPRKRVRVLDDRTSQLLAIAFNRLPPPERVAEIVDSLEDFPDGLTSEAVLALHNAVSEHTEAVEQIRLVVASNQEAINQLDMPERFLLRLSAVEFCNVKLACGALIVGSAKELMDLRLSGQKVGVCCQELRKSKLLQKCISTALAVGNFLNRGTARSGVRGVVLPESLLKLEELRGGSLGDLSGESMDKEKNGGSLLDFVVQAILSEEGVKEDELLKEAENLLAKARAAAGVALEETQASCHQINVEATKVRDSIKEVPPSPGVIQMTQRIERVYEEAALANDIAQKAKDQLAKAQVWSCSKSKVKSNEWFTSWVQFLEILPRTLVRAQEAKARRLAQEAAEQRASLQRPPLSDINSVMPAPEDAAKQRAERERYAQCLTVVQTALAPNRRYEQETTTQPEAKQKSSRSSKGKTKVFDDDARIDNIDWSKVHQHHSMRQENSFDDKENSLH